jgi:hypothetical protein
VQEIIRTMSSRTKNTIFGTLFALCLLAAVFPPFYLSVSGSTTLVFGIPLSAAYWIIDALVLGLTVWALYIVEDIRGEIVDDVSASLGE